MTPAQWKEICLATSCKPKVALPNCRKKPEGLRVRSNGDLHNDQALECINADAVRRVLPASTADSHGSQRTEPELPDEPNHERDICVFLPSADDLDKHLLSLKIACANEVGISVSRRRLTHMASITGKRRASAPESDREPGIWHGRRQ